MKTVPGWITSILGFAMLGPLVSCAATPYIPSDKTVENMSVKQARNVLVTQLKNGNIYYIYNGKRPKLKSGYKITDLRVTSDKLIVIDSTGKQSIFIFSELPPISISGNTSITGL